MWRPGSILRQERGSTIVLALVSMTAVLAASALAIDLGMLVAARSEAQSAADAAALAGAGAFLRPGSSANALARQQALDFATRNTILGEPILASEVEVEVDPEALTVRVGIQRNVTETWFARVLRSRALAIGARAAARASDAPAATCVKPFAIADPALVDPDNPQLVYGQQLALTPGAPTSAPAGNGGGRGRGRARGNGGSGPVTEAWALPTNRGWSGGCGGAAAASHTPPAFRANICSCNQSVIELAAGAREVVGTPALANVHGPSGISNLVSQDPGARWDAGRGEVVGSRYSDWRKSPRVVTIPLYDPAGARGSRIRFTKFIVVFVERLQDTGNSPSARFVGHKRVLRLSE